METAFTPIQSLMGGLLIGFAAVLLMATLGRILGATGILAGFLWPAVSAKGWVDDWTLRLALLLGMMTAPWVYAWIDGKPPAVQVPASAALFLAGGFIVGIGVTLGGGCTSGHGVCGMARLSRRSFAATLIFMAAAAATVFVTRHLAGG